MYERERLLDSVSDIIADTPKPETAGLRVKKAVAKAGKPSAEVFMNVLTAVAADTAKKYMALQ